MNDITQQQTSIPAGQSPMGQPAQIPTTMEQSQPANPPFTGDPAPQQPQGPSATSSTGPSTGPYNSQTWQKRPDGLTLTAGYHFFVAALFLLGTIIMMIPTGILGIVSAVEDPDAMIAMFIVGFIAIIMLVLCLLYLAVGYGLWTLKPWGRVAALALAVVSLFGVPIGTVTGGLTLWYLMQPEVSAKFEESNRI